VKTHVLPTLLLPLFAGCGLSTGAGTTDPHDDASTPSAEAALEDAFVRDAVVPALDAIVNADADDAHDDAHEDARQDEPLVCQAPLTACGSTCTSLETDSENCGACGKSCTNVVLGDSCRAGVCGCYGGVDCPCSVMTNAMGEPYCACGC
jgi:hypothetical protein